MKTEPTKTGPIKTGAMRTADSFIAATQKRLFVSLVLRALLWSGSLFMWVSALLLTARLWNLFAPQQEFLAMMAALLLALVVAVGVVIRLWPAKDAAPRAVDAALRSHDRALTLAELAPSPVREVLEHQLSSLGTNFKSSQAIPLAPSRRERFLLVSLLAPLCCFLFLFLWSPNVEREDPLNELAKLMPELPPKLQERIEELQAAVKEHGLRSPEATQALERASEEAAVQQRQEAINPPPARSTPTPTPTPPPADAQGEPGSDDGDAQNKAEKKDGAGQNKDSEKNDASQDESSKKDQSKKGAEQGKEQQQGASGGQEKKDEKSAEKGGAGGDKGKEDGQGQQGKDEQGKDQQGKKGDGQGDGEGKGEQGGSAGEPGKESGNGQQGEKKDQSSVDKAAQALSDLQKKAEGSNRGDTPGGTGDKPKQDSPPKDGKGGTGDKSSADKKQGEGSGDTKDADKPSDKKGQEKGGKDDSTSNSDKESAKKGASGSAASKEQSAAKELGDGPQGKGVGGDAKRQDVQLKDDPSKSDKRFGKSTGEEAENDQEALPTTQRQQVELGKPDLHSDGIEQPIPLEYRDIIR